MRKTKKRHVVFYCLYELYIENKRLIPSELTGLIEYIKNHTKLKRRVSINTEKFCLLESATFNKEENVYEVIFKSARHSFRPNLINRKTVLERVNPKDIDEGEIEKSHIIIKFEKKEVTICKEKNHGGVSINNFIDYINTFHRKRMRENDAEEQFHYKAEIVPKDDFLKLLGKLKRVSVADIYLDKKILGSHYLNLSDRAVGIRKEVVLSIRPVKGESVKEFTVDAFNKLNSSGQNPIERISVQGKDDENGDVFLNTDFIEKRNTIDVEFDTATGEINSRDMLRKLMALSKLK